jgi:S1-C subfamily serine protease
MPSELIELSNSLALATEKAAAQVVAVHTETRGSSSGVIWRDGVVVTAEHALRRDEEIRVTLQDGSVVEATLAGRDPATDIAVLKCPAARAAVSEFGDAATLKPGHLTLVVGRTRASGPVAALGVVSLVVAERRTWTGTSLSPYIRLDVGLQPTAVGGAVVNAAGRVVGMATPRFARFGAIAIPAAAMNAVVDTLLARGHMPRGFLGVGLQSVRLPEDLRALLQKNQTQQNQPSQKSGAMVLQVEPGGPAGRAGLMIGDILVSLAGRPIHRVEDVQFHTHGDTIGKSLAVRLIRGGALQETAIVVGERPQGGD